MLISTKLLNKFFLKISTSVWQNVNPIFLPIRLLLTTLVCAMPLLYCKEEVSGIFANRVSFCGFPFYGTARKVSKNDGWCGPTTKKEGLSRVGDYYIMVQEGIFLADCTNINGGACHMRTKCTFFSNAAEPTLWYHDISHIQGSAPKNCWDMPLQLLLRKRKRNFVASVAFRRKS